MNVKIFIKILCVNSLFLGQGLVASQAAVVQPKPVASMSMLQRVRLNPNKVVNDPARRYETWQSSREVAEQFVAAVNSRLAESGDDNRLIFEGPDNDPSGMHTALRPFEYTPAERKLIFEAKRKIYGNILLGSMIAVPVGLAALLKHGKALGKYLGIKREINVSLSDKAYWRLIALYEVIAGWKMLSNFVVPGWSFNTGCKMLQSNPTRAARANTIARREMAVKPLYFEMKQTYLNQKPQIAATVSQDWQQDPAVQPAVQAIRQRREFDPVNPTVHQNSGSQEQDS